MDRALVHAEQVIDLSVVADVFTVVGRDDDQSLVEDFLSLEQLDERADLLIDRDDFCGVEGL